MSATEAWRVATGSSIDIALVPPVAAEADEMVIRVEATSLNRGEVRALDRLPMGYVPGLDLAGTVVEAARDGTGPPVGSRVLAMTERRGGGWGTLAAMPTDRVAVLPETLSWADAGALPTAGMTALRALALGGELSGKRVLVTGATGGVGWLACQLAKLAGAQVEATVSKADRCPVLAPLGLAGVHVAGNVQGRFDLIIETVGGSALSEAMRLVEVDGLVATLGGEEGFDVPPEPAVIPHGWFVLAPGARLVALNVMHETARHGSARTDLDHLARLVANGSLDPGISKIAPWAKLGELVGQLRAGEIRGKAVILRTRPPGLG